MPTTTYQATFTVNGQAYGFDVRQNGYGEDTQANVTIRAIPWAQTYTVVIQGTPQNPGDPTGSKPVTRTYQAIVYSEDDYLLLRGQRGQTGTLLTPREQGTGGAGYSAFLQECKRADIQDPSTPDGPQSINLSFVMLT